MNTFTISKNDYLETNIQGFYHTDYTRYRHPGNPDFIVHLKNTSGNESPILLSRSVEIVRNIISADLPEVLSELGWSEALVCTIPRAKALRNYSSNQLLFSQAVFEGIKTSNKFIPSEASLVRYINTRTTHLAYRGHDTEGDMPYIGITKDTCKISQNVYGKNILLIDDVYTKTVNVAEDAIQALIDAGANSVALYVIAKTRFRGL